MSERTSLQRRPRKRGWYLVWDYDAFPCNGNHYIPLCVYVDPDGSYDPLAEPRSPGLARRGGKALARRAFVYLGDEPERPQVAAPGADADR